MKYSLLALPAAVSAGFLEARQAKGFGGLAALGTVTPVAGIDKGLIPEIRKAEGVQRTLTKFGPITLKAASVGAPGPGEAGHGSHGSHGGARGGMDNTLGGQTFFLRMNDGFCNKDGPCTIYGGRVGVMFEDGKVATQEAGVFIHHVLTTDVSKKAENFLSACNNPNKRGSSVSAMGTGTGFIGVGEDSGKRPVLYTRADGSSPSGYWLQKGDNFLANVVLVNYNKEPKKVYITYDTEWAAGEQGTNAKGMLISTSQCGKLIKTDPKGPTNTTAGPFYVIDDGFIIGARGHLHDGGVQVDLMINGKYICSSEATYGGQGSENAGTRVISGMSYFDTPVPVAKGDKVMMNVVYDLAKYPRRKGASGQEAEGEMGMWSLTFEPAKSTKSSTKSAPAKAGTK